MTTEYTDKHPEEEQKFSEKVTIIEGTTEEEDAKSEYDILREDYIKGKILNVGTLVEDKQTGEIFQILDRGPNYIKVAKKDGSFSRKWINEVTETNEVAAAPEVSPRKARISFGGYVAQNIKGELADVLKEQFDETNDHFAYRQAIVNLDKAQKEKDDDKRYSLLETVEEFYNNMNIDVPLIVEVQKNVLEQKRIARVIAEIAGIKIDEDLDKIEPHKVVADSIATLIDRKLDRRQWQIITPVFRLAKRLGVIFRLGGTPIQSLKENYEERFFNIINELQDEFVDDLCYDDIIEAFEDEEGALFDISEDEFVQHIQEVLSYDARIKLGALLRRKSKILSVKRKRALTRTASVKQLEKRARRLALSMLKTRMFKKPAADMTRAEKERFERTASKRKALISRLALKLVPKVRMLQKERLQHSHPAQADTKVDTRG